MIVKHLLLFAHDHNVHLILYADQSDKYSEQSLSFGNMCMYNHFEVLCNVFTIIPLRVMYVATKIMQHEG